NEEDEEIAVGSQRQAEQHERDRHRDAERRAREQQRAAVELGSWRTPALLALAAVCLAFLVRLPFFGTPLTADEGGYAEAARLWERGDTLYRDIWVDRPQGLVLVFRAVLHLGGSPNVIRGVAALVAALSVLATVLLALRLTR